MFAPTLGARSSVASEERAPLDPLGELESGAAADALSVCPRLPMSVHLGALIGGFSSAAQPTPRLFPQNRRRKQMVVYPLMEFISEVAHRQQREKARRVFRPSLRGRLSPSSNLPAPDSSQRNRHRSTDRLACLGIEMFSTNDTTAGARMHLRSRLGSPAARKG